MMLEKLQNMRKNLKKKGKGFTLVELIVVIVVIAIIAAIAIPRITSFQDSARKARIQSEHRELITATQMFIANEADPTTAYKKITDLNSIKAYINLKKADDNLDTVLAKNGENVAHVIDGKNYTLTSTYKPSNGSADEVMVYHYGPKSE